MIPEDHLYFITLCNQITYDRLEIFVTGDKLNFIIVFVNDRICILCNCVSNCYVNLLFFSLKVFVVYSFLKPLLFDVVPECISRWRRAPQFCTTNFGFILAA